MRLASTRIAIIIIGVLAMIGATFAGDRAVVRPLYPACKTVADLTTIIDIVEHQHDQAAFDRFYDAKFHKAKDCIFLRGDQTVVVETSTQEGLLCVRPQGATECYWTRREAFEAEKK